MAVRNMEAIKRHGDMIAQERQNKKLAKEQAFWSICNTIKSCRDDAVDAVDTINALYENGLGSKFETWLKSQNVGYSIQFKRFSVGSPLDNPKEYAYVSYVPERDSIRFAWNGYGMCESYDTKSDNMEHFIHSYYDKKYKEGHERLAARLQPFLNAFFAWTETL